MMTKQKLEGYSLICCFHLKSSKFPIFSNFITSEMCFAIFMRAPTMEVQYYSSIYRNSLSIVVLRITSILAGVFLEQLPTNNCIAEKVELKKDFFFFLKLFSSKLAFGFHIITFTFIIPIRSLVFFVFIWACS